MDFCMRLASEVIINEINESPNKNFVMSPFSLNCLLNLLASGTKGRTLEQLLEFLESESIADINAKSSQMIRLITMDGEPNKKEEPILSDDDDFIYDPVIEPELSFVGGIWTDHKFPIKPSFQQIAKDVYKSEAKTIDFAVQGEHARKEVNMWADNETKGLIKDFIPPAFIDSGTVLVLANALYFKAEWCSHFETVRTKEEEFYLLNGTTVEVPFMKSIESYYDYASFECFKVLKLPYASMKDDKEFSMYIFLPDKNDGLQELVQNFNSQSRFLQKNLQLEEVKLSKVCIPKFKFSYGFEASTIVKKLGLTLPFEPVGDFTEMVDSSLNNLVCVSRLLQKSFIEVNEQGTAAASASVVTMRIGSARQPYPPPPLPSFVTDHPFMFMIKEEVSGIVFFTGTVLNPLKED